MNMILNRIKKFILTVVANLIAIYIVISIGKQIISELNMNPFSKYG